MKINLLAGGPRQYWPDDLFEAEGDWIGVDRGAWDLAQRGQAMLLAVGDFDSVSAAAYDQITHVAPVQRLPRAKDETDLEVAIQSALAYQPEQITIYGATGGRLDHALSALWCLADARYAEWRDRFVICDRQQWCTFVPTGQSQLRQQPAATTLAFMAMGSVVDFTIHDAAYPLTNWSGTAPRVWSSNTFLGEYVTLTLGNGPVLAIQTHDDDTKEKTTCQ